MGFVHVRDPLLQPEGVPSGDVSIKRLIVAILLAAQVIWVGPLMWFLKQWT